MHLGCGSPSTSLWDVTYLYSFTKSLRMFVPEVRTEKSPALCIITSCSYVRPRDKMLLTSSFSMKIHKRRCYWLESYKWEGLAREPGVIPACNTPHQWLWLRLRAMKETSGKQSRDICTRHLYVLHLFQVIQQYRVALTVLLLSSWLLFSTQSVLLDFHPPYL